MSSCQFEVLHAGSRYVLSVQNYPADRFASTGFLPLVPKSPTDCGCAGQLTATGMFLFWSNNGVREP